jgi:cytochrome c oxidase cbb3-type subunit 3
MRNKLKYKAAFLVLLVTAPTLVTGAGKAMTNPVSTWVLHNIIFIVAGLIIGGVMLALWNLTNSIMIDKGREYLRAQGIEPTPPPVKSGESFVSKWYRKAWNLVPIEKETDIQLDHDYDGIKELDNSLPPWWLYGFYVSILIAIGYIYVQHFSDIGMSQTEEYEIAMKRGEDERAAYAARQVNTIDEKNLVMLTDQKSLDVGASIFKANCAACHGQEGQGGVGPNLTDKFWIHGGSIGHIYKTIKNGVPEKGMIAWKTQLQPATMHKIASYIQTLQGTNPPNQKGPQGEPYEEEGGEMIGSVD